MRKKRVAENPERTSVAFTARATEGVHGWSDLNVDKTRLLNHRFPAFARNATSDSSRPQVDIFRRFFRHRIGVGDVAEL